MLKFKVKDLIIDSKTKCICIIEDIYENYYYGVIWLRDSKGNSSDYVNNYSAAEFEENKVKLGNNKIVESILYGKF